jgi:hypothetical protein
VGTNVDLAPADRLAVGMNLDLIRQHLADHQRPADFGTSLLDGLDFQTRSDQCFGESATIKIIRQRGVFAQPAQRSSHIACSHVFLRTRRGVKGVVPLAILSAGSHVLLRTPRAFTGVVPLALLIARSPAMTG